MSSLETCGLPKDVLAPVNSTGGVFESNNDFNYGADALLKIYGVFTIGQRMTISWECISTLHA